VPGYEYQDWWGVFAPSATPPAVVEKVNKEIARVLELPETKQQLLAQGAEAVSAEQAARCAARK
jgi:tripartite-type tricarboxylate transporter receptor subunit TctC